MKTLEQFHLEQLRAAFVAGVIWANSQVKLRVVKEYDGETVVIDLPNKWTAEKQSDKEYP